MVALGGGLFRGTLPPAPCFATIEYSVGVSSAEGAAFRSPADTGENYTAQVLTGTSTIVSHTFETAQGWTVGDPSSPDTATTGVWERADPQGTTAQPGDDHTPAPGVMCWVTGAQAGGGAGDFDVDNGKTTLMSPVFNLAANPEARIGYWRWYSNSQGGAPNADTFVVSVSPDAGTNWAVAETVGPSGPGTNGGWNFHEFRVADILAPTATMKVRFVASDLGTGSLIEALVDDFAITSPVCSASCVTDRDNNLVVNSSDISVYLTAWLADVTAGTFTADFDGLGGTNSTDISAFLTAWLGEVTGGCN